jgi:hypothetical protein
VVARRGVLDEIADARVDTVGDLGDHRHLDAGAGSTWRWSRIGPGLSPIVEMTR